MTAAADQARLQANARAATEHFRLPFRRRSWRGVQGNWQGAGSGSSIDFQDHRPYVPGDDPRYINWQAFARTGNFTMKLYRQEVSPTLDVALDLSGSMFVDEAKAARTAELLYWVAEGAGQAGASFRCHTWRGGIIEPLAMDDILSGTWARPGEETPFVPLLHEIPWRHGSLRVLLSDLLWPGEPARLFQALTDNNGLGVILAPFSRGESNPDWAGNLEMIDCESAVVRQQRVEADTLRRYTSAYRNHFQMWHESAVRYRVPIARIDSSMSLSESLQPHTGEAGAVEWTS